MKRFEKMTADELIDYWTGYVCISIGRGELRSAIWLIYQAGHQAGYAKAANKNRRGNGLRPQPRRRDTA